MEMARLAAERLDMGAQAIALHKRVLDEEPSSSAALDSLEKQAERDKDFATVADVLERRATLADDPASRLAMLLKLGSTYSDRLHDHARAMGAWQRVLALQPGHAKALRVLRESYLAVGDFDGLTALYAPRTRTGKASSRSSRPPPTRRRTPSSRSISASAPPRCTSTG